METIIKQLEDTIYPYGAMIFYGIISALFGYFLFNRGIEEELVSHMVLGVILMLAVVLSGYMYYFHRKHAVRLRKILEELKTTPQLGIEHLEGWCEELKNELGEIDYTPERHQTIFPRDTKNNRYVILRNSLELLKKIEKIETTE